MNPQEERDERRRARIQAEEWIAASNRYYGTIGLLGVLMGVVFVVGMFVMMFIACCIFK